MAAPEKVSMTVYAGSRYRHAITITDDAVAVDLTGYTAAMQVRASVDAAAVLFECDTDDYLHINGAIVALDIPASVSSAWLWAIGKYDLEITSPAGDTYRVIEGTIKVKPEITR